MAGPLDFWTYIAAQQRGYFCVILSGLAEAIMYIQNDPKVTHKKINY